MSKSLKKNLEVNKESEFYDVWELFNGENSLGSYFVPAGITGEQYEDALTSAKDKLFALGFTTLEVKAILGRQLF